MSLVPCWMETPRAQRPSSLHLFSLPLELRNRIYEYCAINYTTEVSFYSPFRGYTFDHRHFLEVPALLRTCRQLAREAGPVLSADVSLRFLQSCGSIMFVSASGPIVPSAIKRLYLELDLSSCQPALHFLEGLLGESIGVSVVRIRWSQRGIPAKEVASLSDSCYFWRPVVELLRRWKGLRSLELVGDYHADFVQCANEALGIEVCAG